MPRAAGAVAAPAGVGAVSHRAFQPFPSLSPRPSGRSGRRRGASPRAGSRWIPPPTALAALVSVRIGARRRAPRSRVVGKGRRAGAAASRWIMRHRRSRVVRRGPRSSRQRPARPLNPLPAALRAPPQPALTDGPPLRERRSGPGRILARLDRRKCPFPAAWLDQAPATASGGIARPRTDMAEAMSAWSIAR
jgi:hypothetical protein